MKLTNASSVPVYTVSGSSTARPLPEHLVKRRKRSQKRDPEETGRVELLQDFGFEESSSCIRISEDGEWVVSTGTYKPQIHVHYLPHLSLSFSRHTDSLNETFQLLSSDYSKSIHLQSDRRVDIHTAGGRHEWVRIPRYGRDLQWIKHSTEALIPAVGVDADGNGEVFRLNLELGRFLKSYQVDVGDDELASTGAGPLQGGVNVGAVNVAAVAQDSHNLLAFGTSLGTVEFHDPRSRSRVAVLAQPRTTTGHAELTALQFHPQGLTFASGNSQGLIHLYDLRSRMPLLVKDQGYGFPIETLTFLTSSTSSNRTAHLSSEPKILSADKRIIKVWDATSGAPWTSVEPAVDLHSVAWFPDSGMILTANEGREQHSFFVPPLGPAPKWCSFLDNLVEEMAEDANDPSAYKSGTHTTGEVYDNYKFVTLPQLKTLSLEHLIGKTGLLRPYMHGYFIDQNLYSEAQLIAQPDLWQDAREKRIKERIEKERQSRTRGTDKHFASVKVNKSLATRLQQKEAQREERNELRKARRAHAKGEQDAIGAVGEAGEVAKQEPEDQDRPSVLKDPRFSRVFQDKDFAVDETSREYQALNAGNSGRQESSADFVHPSRRYTAVEQEEMSARARRNSMSSAASDSESEDEGQAQRQAKARRTNGDTKIASASYTRPSGGKPVTQARQGKESRPREQGPRMHVSGNQSNRDFTKRAQPRNASFGSRVASLPTRDRTFAATSSNRTPIAGGDKSVTFAPGSNSKQRNSKDSTTNREGNGSGIGNDNQQQRKDRRSASGNTFRRL